MVASLIIFSINRGSEQPVPQTDLDILALHSARRSNHQATPCFGTVNAQLERHFDGGGSRNLPVAQSGLALCGSFPGHLGQRLAASVTPALTARARPALPPRRMGGHFYCVAGCLRERIAARLVSPCGRVSRLHRRWLPRTPGRSPRRGKDHQRLWPRSAQLCNFATRRQCSDPEQRGF
jgi:hypothetical protein